MGNKEWEAGWEWKLFFPFPSPLLFLKEMGKGKIPGFLWLRENCKISNIGILFFYILHVFLTSCLFFPFLLSHQMQFYFSTIILEQPSTLLKFNSLLPLQDSNIVLASNAPLVGEAWVEFGFQPLLCWASHAPDIGLWRRDIVFIHPDRHLFLNYTEKKCHVG